MWCVHIYVVSFYFKRIKMHKIQVDVNVAYGVAIHVLQVNWMHVYQNLLSNQKHSYMPKLIKANKCALS